MSLLVKNGRIFTAQKTLNADIRVVDGKIKEIGSLLPLPQEQIIDAMHKYVLPGAIDVHTHLDLDTGTTKTADDFYTGTRAAIAGGTTSIVDFATQEKGGSLAYAHKVWKEKAKDACCDYGFHMAIVDWNADIEAEMLDMVEAGIPSFKLYMAYKGSLQVDDGVIYRALRRAKQIGGLIGFHCENGDLVVELSSALIDAGKTAPYYHPISRPDLLEEEAVFRLCTIAQAANAPIWIVHLSCEKALRIVQKMKKQGLSILTETCPQYLVLDDRLYGTEADLCFDAAKYVLSPPLRKKTDQDALWQALKNGEIDLISTDHCSFNFKGQKELGLQDFRKIPNGGPGIEHRLPLLYHYGVTQGRISLNRMVDLLSETPSERFGLSDKGVIEVGKDADLVIFDPNEKTLISAATQMQNVDYTPYEGLQLSGKIESVLLRGQLVFDQGQFSVEHPTGKYIKRKRGL